jgi:hypothetical protein
MISQRPHTQGGGALPGTRHKSPITRRPYTQSQQLRFDRSLRTYTAHTRPQTTQIKNSPRIGFSITRARIATAKPKYQVKPLQTARPQTTGGIPTLPAIIPNSRQWTALKQKKTEEMENQTIEQMEYEMEALNSDQRDSVLQTLYQTQVVRDKYNHGKDYQEEDDE